MRCGTSFRASCSAWYWERSSAGSNPVLGLIARAPERWSEAELARDDPARLPEEGDHVVCISQCERRLKGIRREPCCRYRAAQTTRRRPPPRCNDRRLAALLRWAES